MEAVPTTDTDGPLVSVIMITRDRHAGAEAAVASILAADYPPARREVIVVEETDTPQPLAGAGVQYRAIPIANRGFGYARNQGLRLARGEFLAFTDDDCRVAPDWLNELVRPLLEQPDVVAVGGAVEAQPCGPIGQCEHILGFPGGGLRYIHEAGGALMDRPTFSTCNCALRKSALERAGGFSEALRHGGEDETLSRVLASLGRIVFAPRARVRHQPRDTLRGVWQWFARRGQACMEQGRNFRRRDEGGNLKPEKTQRPTPITDHLLPPDNAGQCRWRWRLLWRSPVARLAAVLGVCAVLRWPPAPILGVLAALYYGSVLWRQRWAWRTYPSWQTLLCLPVVKLVMDVAMDAGIAKGILARRDNS